MKLNAYCIKDTKIASYSPPFYSHTHGSALRAFSDHVNDGQSQPNKHPEDFALYCVGTWDDQLGELLGNNPVHIGDASEYKKEN